MGAYKGIPMDEVDRILADARSAGFKEIKLNYIAGIDPLPVFERGMRRLRRLGLVDAIGLSIFTAFSPEQVALRAKDAWATAYYIEVIKLVKDLGIAVYKPTFFEMGYPLGLL